MIHLGRIEPDPVGSEYSVIPYCGADPHARTFMTIGLADCPECLNLAFTEARDRASALDDRIADVTSPRPVPIRTGTVDVPVVSRDPDDKRTVTITYEIYK